MGGDIDPNEKLTDVKAFMIIIKCFIGPGMFALPFALAHAGFAVGVSGLLFFDFLSYQGIMRVIQCAIDSEKRLGKRFTSYPELSEAIAGKKFGMIVSFLVCFAQLGVCCVAINFVSTNLLAIIPCDQRAHLVMNSETESIKILKESECFGLPSSNVKRVFVVIILPIFILFSWLPSIKSVAPFAKVANYFMLMAMGGVIYYAGRSFYLVGIADTCVMWPTSPAKVFMFVGNCFYSFEGVSAMVPLTAAMSNRDNCIPIMHKALLVIITMQIVIAVSCYVSFQDINNGSITAVLASNRRIDITPFALLMMNMLVVTAVVFTFPIPFFPAIQLLESWLGLTTGHHEEHIPIEEEVIDEEKARKLKKKKKKKDKKARKEKERSSKMTSDGHVFNPLRGEDYSEEEDAEPQQLVPTIEETGYCLPCKQIAFRTFVVFCLAAVVEAVPDLALIIDLFGSVFGSALSIIIPCYLSLKCEQFEDPESKNRGSQTKILTLVFSSLMALGAAGATIMEMASGEAS